MMKTKIKILGLLLFLLLTNYAYSQDIIFKLDGTEIQCKVIEITFTEIKYQLIDQPNGPIRSISKNNTFLIKYDDGKIENFKIESNNNKIEPSLDQEDTATPTQYPTEENASVVKAETRKEKIDVFDFCMRIGWYFPEDKSVHDIYGSAFNPGIDFRYWGRKAIGVGSSIDLISKKGKPYEYGDVDYSSSKIFIIPIRTSMLITYLKDGNIRSYGGIGLGIDFVSESIKLSAFGEESEEIGRASCRERVSLNV